MTVLQQAWHQRNALSIVLRPLSWCYRLLFMLRRWAYRSGLKHVYHVGVPVIVVGNISVGGTGKTPLVIWLVESLRTAGYKPGIVARGYRGKAKHWPQQVRPDSDPVIAGDEAVLLAARSRCPVAVAPKRVEAAQALLTHHDCNIIISDDGLQHYALGRDIEIAVIDGIRRFGNGFCLPAGPLREPVHRLNSVDYIVVTEGGAMQREHMMRLIAERLVSVRDAEQSCTAERLGSRRVHAVAGIGNPRRFFMQLRRMGLEVVEHPFPDHHDFTAGDLQFAESLPLIMTEKDAVKCRRFAADNWWYLPVSAEVDDKLKSDLLQQLRTLDHLRDSQAQSDLEENQKGTRYG